MADETKPNKKDPEPKPIKVSDVTPAKTGGNIINYGTQQTKTDGSISGLGPNPNIIEMGINPSKGFNILTGLEGHNIIPTFVNNPGFSLLNLNPEFNQGLAWGENSLKVGPLPMTANPFYNNALTKEEIEKIVDKKIPSKNEGSIKKGDVAEMIKEIIEDKSRQENEKVSIIDKKGLEFMAKELLNGKETEWHCGKCRAPLESFKEVGDVEKIKTYLAGFKNNVFKKCKNGHQNSFEIKEGAIVWSVRVTLEKEFNSKKG